MNLIKGARFFLAIHEEGHFGHAAARLGITQPPLSQGLKRLEGELGLTLLDRGPGGVALTDAGAALLPLVRTLLDAEDELRTVAGGLAAAQTGLRLGVVPDLPIRITADLVASWASDRATEVHLQTAASTAIIDDILRRRLDVGVVEHPAVVGDLVGGDVIRLPTWLLVPGEGPADGPLRRLVTRPMAVTARRDAPAARDLLADTLLQHGVTHGLVTVPDDRAALALVAGGRACTVTADPDLAVPGGGRVALGADLLPLRVRVLHRGGAEADGARQLEDRLRSMAAAAS